MQRLEENERGHVGHVWSQGDARRCDNGQWTELDGRRGWKSNEVRRDKNSKGHKHHRFEVYLSMRRGSNTPNEIGFAVFQMVK